MPLETGAGGLERVVLAAKDGSATAEIYRHGATLTSWKVDGAELIFESPNAAYAPPKAIRGGVPVCFPQFAMLGPLKTQHGFARNMPWEVTEDAGDSCTLVLSSHDATLEQWPHPFKLTMKVSLLSDGALQQSLAVCNTGAEPWGFTCALHTYFTVSDIANASVVGLKGLQYYDNAANGTASDNEAAVTFPGEVDRAYIGAPSPLKILDTGRKSVVMIHKRGFADAVVWNPAEAKAAAMADLGSPHWRSFVCVEVAQARSGAIELAAGQEWVGETLLEYDTLGES